MTHRIDDPAERRIAKIALFAVVLLHGGLLLAVRAQMQSRDAAPVPALQVILIPADVVPAIPPPPPMPEAPRRPARTPAAQTATPRTAPDVPPASAIAPVPLREPPLESNEDFAARAPSTPSWRQPGMDGDGMPERRSGSAMLPGRTEAFARIEGMRDRPSPADVVRAVGSFLFGGGEGDSCAKREARLLNETDPTVREIDLRNWKRLCKG